MGIRERASWLPQRIGYVHGPRLMSYLRRRWVLLRHPKADIRFGSGVYLGPGFSLHLPGKGSFIVGDDVEFRRNFRAEMAEGARIRIGSGTRFTYDTVLACTTTMTIGERCAIAQGTLIADGNHRFRDPSRPFYDQGFEFHAIVIEDDVLIHSKCTVVASIGRHAVIGGNAMVTKPVPPYTLAGGVPARVLDSFGPPGEAPHDLDAPAGSTV